jgi:hypothetical protein
MPNRATAAQSVAPRTAPAMSNERKAFWHSPYTNADAQVVKQKKGLPTLDAAKEFIGAAVLTKKEADLGKLGVTRANYDDQDCLTRFKRSGFTESDVKQARKSFDFLKGASDNQVKWYLGLKVLNAKDGYGFAKDFLKNIGATKGWGA